MDKTAALDCHFAKWRQQTRNAIKTFHADGIVHEPTYSKAKLKLCYLMKEPNNPPKDDFGAKFDFREWWRDEPIKGGFSARIAEWSFGLLNGFPPYDNVWSTEEGRAVEDIRRSIALVNVKKSGGVGSTEHNAFMRALGASEKQQAVLAELVREELRIIDPDVVVMGLRLGKLRETLFRDVNWTPSGYSVDLCLWEGRVLIDFYHPSARAASAAAYCLLEKVTSGAVYLDLLKAGKVARNQK